MAHRIDPLTDYCTRCGAALTEIVEGGARRTCQAEDSSVVGISHVIAKRLQDEAVEIDAWLFGPREPCASP
jgi:hypothetical protein